MSDYTPDEIETGRKLFAGDWRFTFAAGTFGALPAMRGLEIAFAGRSNVGKSSLINALTGRNALARTSHTPGRTQELIFFTGPTARTPCRTQELIFFTGPTARTPADPLTLVDMPGYGYAAASKTKVKAWTALIHAFLAGRASLARVYLLVDARHGLKPVDDTVLRTLDKAAVNYQLVLTKADQVGASDLEARIAATNVALAKHPAAFPEVLATSSRSGAGMPELRAAIARLVAERART